MILGDDFKSLIFADERHDAMANLIGRLLDDLKVSRYNSGGGSLNLYGRAMNYLTGQRHWFGDESEARMRRKMRGEDKDASL